MRIRSILMHNYQAALIWTARGRQPGVEGGQHFPQSLAGSNSGMRLRDTAPEIATTTAMTEVKFISWVWACRHQPNAPGALMHIEGRGKITTQIKWADDDFHYDRSIYPFFKLYTLKRFEFQDARTCTYGSTYSPEGYNGRPFPRGHPNSLYNHCPAFLWLKLPPTASSASATHLPFHQPRTSLLRRQDP